MFNFCRTYFFSIFHRCIFIGMSAFALSSWADGITVTRLQARVSDSDSIAFTESIYHQFVDKLYFLQLYDDEVDGKNSYHHNERFEINVGKPINMDGQFGWVFRAQKWSGYDPIYSGGTQWDFNSNDVMRKLLEKSKIKTFLQVFVKGESEQMGYLELLHYYQLRSGWLSPIEIRGNNVYYQLKSSSLFNSWIDFIYPVRHNADVYMRVNYLDKDDPRLGYRGATTSVGFRINF